MKYHRLMLLFVFSVFSTITQAKPRNVLLICVDDLRPELKSFGADYIHSPNIDRLAAQGRRFVRHYVNAPSCGPSRYTLLTGRYGSAGNNALFIRADDFAKNPGNVPPSMPEWFRKHGYTTVSVGKVSHHPGGLGGGDWNDPDKIEIPNAWDRYLMPVGEWQHPRGAMHGLAHGEIRKKAGDMDLFQSTEGPDTIYPDGLIAEEGIKQLKELAAQDQPFLLAIGLIKPHLPFGAPKKYMQPYEGVTIPSIAHPEKPQGQSTWHGSGEFMKYNRWGKDPRQDEAFALEVKRHYAACVTYADKHVGDILNTLKRTGADKDTIVILWGDHGWHLGEHAIWGKHSLFEESLHSPLIISYPGMEEAGAKTDAVVETLDLFPTLCDLTGVKKPSFVTGQTLLPQLKDPQTPGHTALGYHGKARTLRTSTHRIIVHKDKSVELYDHTTPSKETKNVADQQPAVVAALKEQLVKKINQPYTKSSQGADAEAQKPNVVLIMADDVSWECFGCYGAEEYETPHIDRLAADGIQFEHCYSTPICTPSRVMIMTGKYNFRNYTHFGYLNPKEKTFGHLMQEAGYKTAIAGKWQLNGLYNNLPGYDDNTRPYKAGFDEYCLWQVTLGKQNQRERFWSPVLEHNGRLLSAQDNHEQYGPDIFCDFICDFMARNKEQPFFAYYPMVLVHDPFVPTPDTIGDAPRTQIANKQGKDKKANFQAMVNYMDKIVGRIRTKTETLGIAENTIIIFTADNGTNRAITSRWNGQQIKGGKGGMKDMGTHVPMVAYWKGHSPQGKVLSDLIDFTDIYPTLAEVAGIQLQPADIIDGRSFLPQLQGEPGQPRDWALCHYQPYWNQTPGQFARTAQYKLYRDGRFYEPAQDLKEERDLSRQLRNRQVREEYRKLNELLDKVPPAPTKKEGKNAKERPIYPDWKLLHTNYLWGGTSWRIK